MQISSDVSAFKKLVPS